MYPFYLTPLGVWELKTPWNSVMHTISHPNATNSMDFIGLNYYTHLAVRFKGYPDLFEMLVRADLIPTGLSTRKNMLT